jgi:opacity protein-like surface antigen
MKNDRKLILRWAILILFVSAVAGPVDGRGADFPLRSGVKEIGFRLGYSVAAREDVQALPLSLSLGYIFYSGKFGLLPSGALEIVGEPFVSPIASSKGGFVEAGLAFPVFRYNFDVGSRFVPYVEGGSGLMYTDLKGFNLGGKFQFLSFGGLGLSYFLTENHALNIGWRFRHISNAGIHRDNSGLNSFIVQAGFSFLIPGG